MAAIVNINRFTGASTGVATNITSANTRANADDTHSTAGTSNPVAIPTSGTNYSFWVHTQLEVMSGLGGTLDNLRWFMSGSLDTGISLYGEAASAYVQATGTVGDTGDILSTGNHPGLVGAPVDLTSFSVGSPKTIAGSTTSTGVVGNFMVYQFGAGITAQPGAISAITMAWKYDET